MDETIPSKEIVKSDTSRRQRFSTNTTKANKSLMQIYRAIKRNQLNTLSTEKKALFIERTKKVVEKYKITKIDI